jgi:LysR family glycine cleavage system transcriptional activator
LPDRIGPVLAPALQKRHRLTRPIDLRKLALLHTDTRPQAWPDWLRLSGTDGVDPAGGQRFEHTYFLLEAAASGLGVAIASLPLVKEDLASGRLVAPFGFVTSESSYYLLHAKRTPASARIAAFSAWIAAEARNASVPDAELPTGT